MRAIVCLVAVVSSVSLARGEANVLTANYNNSRTNANPNETILKPVNVNSAQFGRLFAFPVDGATYSQPLFVGGLDMPDGATHNVLFVSTMHNTLYAFDADAWNGQPLWSVTLGTAVPAAAYFTDDISPEVGILSTPVIDANSKTIYVVSNNYENATISYHLHAIDITTGAERTGSPAVIQAVVRGTGVGSIGGILAFDPAQHLQRPGLLLASGTVYAAFGSHADFDPYHGWIMAYDASDVSRQTAVFCVSPNGTQGAIWQSGRGLAADASGNVYAATGNGDFDGVTSFGESILKLTPDLKLEDWFAPDSWLLFNQRDYDLGSSGIVLMPGTDLLLGGGKSGVLFTTPTGQLGHIQPGNVQASQALMASSRGIFNLALWDGEKGPVVFVQNSYFTVEGYLFRNGLFETNASLISPLPTGTAYEGFAVSSDGKTPGTAVLWVTTADGYGLKQPGQLVAFDAADPATVLWTSNTNAADNYGYFAKFVPPTIANGKVYVPTFSNQVVVYGLRDAQAALPQISAVANAASYSAGSVAPGEIVTIFGTGVGPLELEQAALKDGALDTDAETQVTFNGIPAPVIYDSSTAVAVVVPFELGGDLASVQVTYQGKQSPRFLCKIAPAVPGLFSVDSSGAGPGAFLNQDLSLNTADNPAARGDVLVLYGTGHGTFNTTPANGAIVQSPPPTLTGDVSVEIGGVRADLSYAGATPGSVAGLVQMNVVVPPDVTPGSEVPVVVRVGDSVSQVGLTAAIR